MRRALALTVPLLVAGCGSGSGSDPATPEVPALPRLTACDPVRHWDPARVAFEQELLQRIDDLRATGASCGDRGTLAPAPPLRPNGTLWCAARLHVADMAARGYVAHEDPDGNLAWDRLRALGYAFFDANEVIAAGDFDPQAVLDEVWLPRSGSCAALLAAESTEIGVGYVEVPGAQNGTTGGPWIPPALWTVVVATPR